MNHINNDMSNVVYNDLDDDVGDLFYDKNHKVYLTPSKNIFYSDSLKFIVYYDEDLYEIIYNKYQIFSYEDELHIYKLNIETDTFMFLTKLKICQDDIWEKKDISDFTEEFIIKKINKVIDLLVFS